MTIQTHQLPNRSHPSAAKGTNSIELATGISHKYSKIDMQ